MDIITKILAKKNYLPNGLSRGCSELEFKLKSLFEFKKQSLPEEFENAEMGTGEHCVYEIKEYESVRQWCE